MKYGIFDYPILVYAVNESEFIAREQELNLLDKLWHSEKSSLLILYGRRRVGKTRLLTHWRKRYAEHALYWVAEPTSALSQLRSFSQALYNFFKPQDAPQAPQEFTYASWEQALQQVAIMGESRRFALLIDEFTYLIDVDAKIVGTLQKVWDHWLNRTSVMLVLSGSQMGLMQKQMLSHQAPLYGRSTAQIKLPPLPFGATQRFFPNYTAADRVAIYSIWGGIPAYWEQLDQSAPVMTNVQSQLMPVNSQMQDEPRLLLQDFVNDPYNYVGIMRAIVHGSRTQSRIATYTGLPKGHISRYISVLRETGFVTRRVPVTEVAAASRRGRYFVTDPYLRFYYHFLAAFQAKLAIGEQADVLAEIEKSLPAFIQTSTWQELCQEWLLRASARGELALPIEKVGGAWTRHHTFNVVGIHQGEKSMVLGSCIWRDGPADLSQIQDIISRTSAVIPKKGKWTVHYVGFSAAGWSEEAQRRAERVVQSTSDIKNNWQPGTIKLLDLAKVDSDLTRWALYVQ